MSDIDRYLDLLNRQPETKKELRTITDQVQNRISWLRARAKEYNRPGGDNIRQAALNDANALQSAYNAFDDAAWSYYKNLPDQ